MRLDKYLKVSRLIKRRTVANEACDAGRILVNDKVAKASLNVKPGDIIEIQFGNRNTKVEVLSINETYKKDENGNLIEDGEFPDEGDAGTDGSENAASNDSSADGEAIGEDSDTADSEISAADSADTEEGGAADGN